MLLSAVSSSFYKRILTNNDGHFECFSLKNANIRTYLETSLLEEILLIKYYFIDTILIGV
jgi:hypothetical protein